LPQVRKPSSSLWTKLSDDILEYKTRKTRIQNIAKKYLELDSKEREQTLILTDLNKDRADLTKILRDELKKSDVISKEEITQRILVSKDLSEVQKKNYWSYEIGDIVVPVRDIEGSALKKRLPIYRREDK
jgi:hypothetical protein